MARTYAGAGVDVDAAERFAEFIHRLDPAQSHPGTIGGFAGRFDIDCSAFTHPVLFSTTDGVGTKTLVARALGRYDTIGIDLVAMCVNDLAVHGAKPIQFLDYIACASIDRAQLDPLMRSILRGCQIAGCSLSGGETAEMPDAYRPGEIDLAGFAVGIAERDAVLPKMEAISAGCPIYGLPSSGIHSNGFSLARSVISQEDRDEFASLLEPTKIYVSEMLPLAASGSIAAAAHVTGGGLEANISRVMPEGMRPVLSYEWPIPRIFSAIQRRGKIDDSEMRRVFNMGIGVAVVIPLDRREHFEEAAADGGIEAIEIGSVARV